MFEIDRTKENGKALYLQIYQLLKKHIKNELNSDDKLPPIRKLAAELDVNPATVARAYNILDDQGLIYKKVGRGSFVAPKYSEQSLGSEKNKSMLKHGQIDLSENINFASAAPSTDLFPVADFKYAINKVLDRDQGEAFTYQKSQGYLGLRHSIREYFLEDGIKADLEQIQIVSGAQQAIDIMAKILIEYGDKVVVEEPTYFGALQAFKSRKAQIKSIKMLKDGLDLDKFEDYLKNNKIKFLFTMQNFHNPTGINWSNEKQLQLLELADKYNFYIIEDDLLSELYYSSNKVSSLKKFDENGRVIFIKSFSKVFMPGLRLAFIILPDNLLAEILETKYATDISSAGLTQRAFDYYLREGLFNKHINLKRELFKKRFKVMASEIEKQFSGLIELKYKPKGGLYFWLKLPETKNSHDFYEVAANKGVVFSPGSLFSIDQKPSRYFRLSFAAVNEQEISLGIKLLANTARNFLDDKKNNSNYSPLL
ncbi:PLP-dependent aminotransferase family protein [Halanaerobium hydrogeniformans]|uniref:Transcriptional regulator, GntR family with aminotransferase domain n=1 Tax=Halanaerobium hydrogeniformans TaxID=656519 RepID=E4RKX0_HALHG|nr:PLP-dependent aminotransferase family protein [Halanaerobium hydrogeniformans]ADQ15711.1 transcriptional regulator, GntR family with aminotransferase domain [Halanaerobium hydrogeniformans]